MLATSFLVLMISFIVSVAFGVIIIPILRRFKASQTLSVYLRSAHKNKVGTPTMGGLIFIIPPLLIIIFMFLFGKLDFNYNLCIVLFTFISYALIGFIDDFLIIIRKNNNGLSVNQKFFLQLIVSVIFFYLFMKALNEPIFWIQTLNIKWDIGFLYGVLILIILVSSSNAVNITDGLDGLAGSLSFVSFITIGIITWNTEWLLGYREISLFCFMVAGSLLGFLMFNINPAKVFMGDTGSLCLGATMGSISILIRHELLLVVIGIVFVIETVTCILQIIVYKLTGKRLFPITPIHHTFERMGYSEGDIVKIFLLVGIIGSLLAIIFGIYL